MPRTVKCALIQCSNAAPTDLPIEEIKRLNIEKHLVYRGGGETGRADLCMQEIFTTPYFCAEQQTRWYEAVERIPDGPTVRLMQEVAKEHGMVIIVPIYEEEITGIYYNTAAVIDADGKYLGKYRKNHIPHVNPGFWEKFYFRPGNLGYPCFDTAFARIGVYICYDRTSPKVRERLAERRGDRFQSVGNCGRTFRISLATRTTGARGCEWLFHRRDQSHRHEQPWDIGEFYGQSYFCDPRGQFVAEAPRDKDALIVADLDLDKIREVRNTWQFSAIDRTSPSD